MKFRCHVRGFARAVRLVTALRTYTTRRPYGYEEATISLYARVVITLVSSTLRDTSFYIRYLEVLLTIAHLKLESVLRVAAVVVRPSYYIEREIYIAYRYRFIPFYYLYNSYLNNRRDYRLRSYILHRLRYYILRNILKIGPRYLL